MQKLTSSCFGEERLGKLCPYCNAKLSLKEQHRKKHSTGILCKYCGETIPGDMVLIGNTKFPKTMIRKRF